MTPQEQLEHISNALSVIESRPKPDFWNTIDANSEGLDAYHWIWKSSGENEAVVIVAEYRRSGEYESTGGTTTLTIPSDQIVIKWMGERIPLKRGTAPCVLSFGSHGQTLHLVEISGLAEALRGSLDVPLQV